MSSAAERRAARADGIPVRAIRVHHERWRPEDVEAEFKPRRRPRLPRTGMEVAPVDRRSSFPSLLKSSAH